VSTVSGAVCLKKWKSPRKIKTTAHIGHDHVRENTILHLWIAVIGAKVLQTTFSVENASNSLDLGLEQERKFKRLLIFPIRIDNSIFQSRIAWASFLKNTRHMGDFTNYKNPKAYKEAFNRLVRDLKGESKRKETVKRGEPGEDIHL